MYDLKEIDYERVYWIHLPQVKDRWLGHISTVMNLLVRKKCRRIFKPREVMSASKRTLLQRVIQFVGYSAVGNSHGIDILYEAGWCHRVDLCLFREISGPYLRPDCQSVSFVFFLIFLILSNCPDSTQIQSTTSSFQVLTYSSFMVMLLSYWHCAVETASVNTQNSSQSIIRLYSRQFFVKLDF